MTLLSKPLKYEKEKQSRSPKYNSKEYEIVKDKRAETEAWAYLI